MKSQKHINLVRLSIMRIALLFVMTLVLHGCSDDSTSSVSQRDIFMPFQHMSGIVPGKTFKSEVVLILGEPDKIEVSMHGIVRTDEGPREFGGHQIFYYTALGLELLIGRENLEKSDPPIDSVFATEQYKGVAPNGLRIGMGISKALQICDRSYNRIKDSSGRYYYANKPGGDSEFIIVFSKEKLSHITMHPSD